MPLIEASAPATLLHAPLSSAGLWRLPRFSSDVGCTRSLSVTAATAAKRMRLKIRFKKLARRASHSIPLRRTRGNAGSPCALPSRRSRTAGRWSLALVKMAQARKGIHYNSLFSPLSGLEHSHLGLKSASAHSARRLAGRPRRSRSGSADKRDGSKSSGTSWTPRSKRMILRWENKSGGPRVGQTDQHSAVM